MGFLTRQPTSNDKPVGQSPWGPRNDLEDDFFLLLSEQARRCTGCRRVTLHEHLDDDVRCPDCRG